MILISKYIAQAGIASRRQAGELVKLGKVRIETPGGNVPPGKLIGYRVDESTDKVFVNDELIRPKAKIYLMMNKPRGYVCTRGDRHAKKTVFDLLPPKYKKEGLFTVGRLDKDTEGLLLLTNDGDWSNKLTHPRYEKEKEYYVLVRGDIKTEDFERLQHGLMIAKQKYKAKLVEYLDRIPKGQNKDHLEQAFSMRAGDYWCRVVLSEGKKRQIRVMFEKVGAHVVYLQRVRVGDFKLGRLGLGEILGCEKVAQQYIEGTDTNVSSNS